MRRSRRGARTWPLLAATLLVLALVTGYLAGEQFESGTSGSVGALYTAIAIGLVALGVALWGIGLRSHLRQMGEVALRDPLTGLPNRMLLDDRIEQAFARSRRSGDPFALIVIDLDGFKEVNDLRGHRAGDAVLCGLAERLQDVVRASDTVARVGGDEFVVLSLGTSDELEASALVTRLRQALRRQFDVDGAPIEIDASIGWALFPSDGATPDELLGHADGEMYATKRDTGDRVGRRGGLDAGIVLELESALEQGELVVHYQPILDLRSGEVRGAEALLRHAHPERGLVAPNEFLPHVERTPLIRAVTLHVVGDALQRVARWREAGHDLRVAINVPYRSLDDGGLADGIAEHLRSTGVEPFALTLDVIPSGPIAGVNVERLGLERLLRLGVRLSLDDFGRASSLAAARVLPLDEVKIDRSFVAGLGRNPADSAIVQALIELGHELGVVVAAEGIESRAAWDELASRGCDLGQGYYVLGPTPADELAEWLERGWPVVGSAAHS